MKRGLVSEEMVSGLPEGSTLRITKPFIVTPSAADVAEQRSITIVEVTPSDEPPGSTPQAEPASQQGSDHASLAARIDSTLLDPEATPDQIVSLCNEAVALTVKAVCVNPIFVELAVSTLNDRGPVVAVVCGFPLGATPSIIKAAEAGLAEAQGAREFDMVLSLGQLKAGNLVCVHKGIAKVRKALKNRSSILKVIIEAPLLTNEEKVMASIVAVEAGADFVKTGTGKSGPATVEDVILIRQSVGGHAQIKAAGGIRDRYTARRLLSAGADRIGTSRAAIVLNSQKPDTGTRAGGA